MKVLTKNRRARFNYQIEKTVVAGIELLGSEVKAIRMGRMQLQDAFVDFRGQEAWLIGSHIGEYPYAKSFGHEPRRERRLLLKRDEIDRWSRKVRERGFSVVPLDVHLSEKGWVKITLGLGKGKRTIDKRETIKKRDQERDMQRREH
ncbi:MAG: SsrA-binding protein [Myxococcales bacterium]|nr:SsrA-binding protein [Myxococcales bacterium]